MFKTTLLLLVGIFLSSCGKKSEIDGRWETACVGDKTYKVSQIISLGFDGDKFESRVQNFSGAACETHRYDDVVNGTIALGTVNAEGQTEIDYRPTLVQWTIAHEDTLKLANEEGVCGITDWKAGEPRDVTVAHGELGCKGKSATQTSTTSSYFARTRFSIVKVDAGKLYIGIHGGREGRNPEERLQKLSEFPLEPK